LIALSGVALSVAFAVGVLIGGVIHRVEVLVTGVDELFALLLGMSVDLFVIRVKLFVVLSDIVDDIDDVGDRIRDDGGGSSSSCSSGGGRDSAPAKRNGDGSCSRYYRDRTEKDGKEMGARQAQQYEEKDRVSMRRSCC
jgi:hypothetical protein